MTDFQTIRVERHDRVSLITLDRPEALNALNETLMREVVGVVVANDEDPGISVTVITGSDRAFAAGADIKEMADLSAAQMRQSGRLGEWDRVAAAKKPLIAAVAGHALGGGCELALMCDLVIAADTAKFGQPEIKIGVMPGLGGSQRLTRAIGKARAMDLILTGRSIGAEDAAAWGIVSRVVPADALIDEALGVAQELAQKSLPVLIAAKAAVLQAQEGPLTDGIRFEREHFYDLFDLADQKEGMAAFVAKRTPEWQHK